MCYYIIYIYNYNHIRLVFNLSKSVFNKKISHCCEYCANAQISSALNVIFCKFKGPVSAQDSCMKYKYDPLKRTPRADAKLPTYTADDFRL